MPNPDGPLPSEEIARVLAAMQTLDPWDIPEDVASALDVWEQQINRHGIKYRDLSMENLFP